jgi:predicted HD phosphohydrolase
MGSAIDDPVSHVLDCFRLRGACNYGKEAVTQQEYALQAAYAAEHSNASAQLVAACLLHDIGHMLHDLPEDAPDHHIDDEHEQLGAAWLVDYFVPEVVEPVRLHVATDRILPETPRRIAPAKKLGVTNFYFGAVICFSKQNWYAMIGGPRSFCIPCTSCLMHQGLADTRADDLARAVETTALQPLRAVGTTALLSFKALGGRSPSRSVSVESR